MAEYINREALITEYDRVHIGEAGGARKLMVEAPACDVVEVVRCKDCKHSKKAVGNNGIIICVIDSEVDEETGIDYGFVTYYSENHFCGYGERRSE